MKIAIFSDTFFPQVNGVANVAYGSALSLSKLGHEVIVFAPIAPKNRHLLKNLAFEVVVLPSLPAYFYPGERGAVPFSFSALKKLKKFNPDIIHSHTPFSVGCMAVIFAKMLKVKLVGTHHTFYDHYLKHIKMDFASARKFSWKLTDFYYNRCDLVLSPTQSLADEL